MKCPADGSRSPNARPSEQLSFKPKNDTLNEAGETLTVTLDTATSAGTVDVLAGASAFTTTIMPADTVIVSVADVTVVEGNLAIFTVTLSEGAH